MESELPALAALSRGALSCFVSDLFLLREEHDEDAHDLCDATQLLDETWLLADFAWDPVAMARRPV